MTTPRLQELYDTIQSGKDEVAAIREDCKHSEYEVGYYEWAPAHMNVCRICKECDGTVPGLTGREHMDFLKTQPVLVSGVSILSQEQVDTILTTAGTGWGDDDEEQENN